MIILNDTLSLTLVKCQLVSIIMETTKKLKQDIHQYTAIFELNENDGYTVTVPTLPGLVTKGATLEKARIMTKDAIRCYIEGLKVAKESIPLEREIANIRLSIVF